MAGQKPVNGGGQHYLAAGSTLAPAFSLLMPVVPSADFKRALRQLPEKEKETLLLRAARRDAEFYEALCFELLDDVTLASVQHEAEDRIHELFNVSVSGYLLHKSLPKVLS